MLKTRSAIQRKTPLKSGGALKRTAFAPHSRQPFPKTELDDRPRKLPQLFNPQAFKLPAKVADVPLATQLKRPYVRSKLLLAAYRKIPCQNCFADDGTVACAHSNWSVHGKGERIKADDNRGASLCSTCHMELDQGSRLTEQQRKDLWWAAHVRTITLLLSSHLWIDGVPVPDVAVNPFM